MADRRTLVAIGFLALTLTAHPAHGDGIYAVDQWGSTWFLGGFPYGSVFNRLKAQGLPDTTDIAFRDFAGVTGANELFDRSGVVKLSEGMVPGDQLNGLVRRAGALYAVGTEGVLQD